MVARDLSKPRTSVHAVACYCPIPFHLKVIMVHQKSHVSLHDHFLIINKTNCHHLSGALFPLLLNIKGTVICPEPYSSAWFRACFTVIDLQSKTTQETSGLAS